MAKSKKATTKKTGGPYLASAFFCDALLEEKADGALSAIRIIDEVTVAMPSSGPEDVPSEERHVPVYITGLVSFKTGGSPGEHVIRIVIESPSGKSGQVLERILPFPPQPHGGINLGLKKTIMVNKGGLFWMHVFLDGKRVTRMPLQISIQRVQVETPASDNAEMSKT